MHFERRNQNYNFMHFERQNAFQNAAHKMIFFSEKKPTYYFQTCYPKHTYFFIWPYLLYFIVRLASLHPH